MKQATIRIQVLSDSIGAEWNNIDAAGAAYAAFLETRLAKALAAAGFAADDLSVTYHANLAGYASNSIWADATADELVLEDIVSQVSAAAWQAFCDDESSRDL